MATLEAALNHTLGQGLWTVPLLAFAGGVVSTFLPCTLAMMPLLVGYIGGYSRRAGQDALLFVLGLATVMTVLGILASLAGMAVASFLGDGLFLAVGLLAIVMGLQLLGVIHVPLPSLVKRLPERGGHWVTPYLLGLAFGASASPCGTPFLAAILGFIGQKQNVLLGGVSLFAYAVGQSVLLIAAGLFTGLLKQRASLYKVGQVINVGSGWLFVLTGLLMLAKVFGWLKV
jgi:cytochrome c-type biogenesis protein